MAEASTIALGRGKFRIGDSDSYQDTIDAVFGVSNEIGISQECTLSNELEFKTKRSVESISDIKKFLTRNDLFLDVTIVEASKSNMNLLFSGNNQEENSFYIGSDVVFNKYYRIEVMFLYPDKVSTLTLIMPRCRIISTSDFDLVNVSEPSKPAFTFQSIPVRNSTWFEKLGRVVFS